MTTTPYSAIAALRQLAAEGNADAATELARIEASLTTDSDRARLGFPLKAHTTKPRRGRFRSGWTDGRLTQR